MPLPAPSSAPPEPSAEWAADRTSSSRRFLNSDSNVGERMVAYGGIRGWTGPRQERAGPVRLGKQVVFGSSCRRVPGSRSEIRPALGEGQIPSGKDRIMALGNAAFGRRAPEFPV